MIYGNYGLHAGMAIALEIRRLKSACNKITFQWVKGHQDNMSFEENPEVCLNNKCDEIANIEREEKQNELSIGDLKLNAVLVKKIVLC